MKGRQIPYSADELAWIEERRAWPRDVMHSTFCTLFGRDVTLQNLNALCKRKGWFTGRSGCFVKGQAPANKGKSMPYHPNSAATRFQKGSRTGRAAENYQPIGAERITKDGYRQRKVHDGLPMQSRWQLVQRLEWEAAHGPIPEGFCLKCKGGDRMNTDPSNWILVSRGVLARLNGGRHRKRIPYDAAAAELKPTVLAIAQVEQRAHERLASLQHQGRAA